MRLIENTSATWSARANVFRGSIRNILNVPASQHPHETNFEIFRKSFQAFPDLRFRKFQTPICRAYGVIARWKFFAASACHNWPRLCELLPFRNIFSINGSLWRNTAMRAMRRCRAVADATNFETRYQTGKANWKYFRNAWHRCDNSRAFDGVL